MVNYGTDARGDNCAQGAKVVIKLTRVTLNTTQNKWNTFNRWRPSVHHKAYCQATVVRPPHAFWSYLLPHTDRARLIDQFPHVQPGCQGMSSRTFKNPVPTQRSGRERERRIQQAPRRTSTAMRWESATRSLSPVSVPLSPETHGRVTAAGQARGAHS